MDNTKERQDIKLESRKHLEIIGVKEVISFDEESVVVNTLCGILNVDGKELKVSVLDTDKGVVTLDGVIDSIYYTDTKSDEKHGFFGRLLR